MTKTALNLILALPAEAKPVNQHLGLVRDNGHDRYPLYRNGHISLVISGYGTQNAAAATAWLHQTNRLKPNDVWVNLGIAGHPKHTLGEAFLANGIKDIATADSWILEPKYMPNIASEQLFTVTEPDTSYSLDGMVDMEAAGFYRSALECTTPDKIYCLKVISDNRDNPVSNINGKLVSQLIRDRLDVLEQLLTLTTAGA